MSLPVPGKRLVVKTGTNLLTAGTDRLDLGAMAGIVSQVARLRETGTDVVLVSSGAIAAGRHALGTRGETRAVALRQILAAVGQNRLMSAWAGLFEWHQLQVGQVLLTRADLTNRTAYLNARSTVTGLLEAGVVPVINENDAVGVEEIRESRFGDNDQLSALVAGMVDADLLLILTDLGGLYTADPRLDPGAHLIPEVPAITPEIEALAGGSASGRGTGGMTTKLQAAALATAAGIETIIAGGHDPAVIVRAAAGDPVGTRFVPRGTRLEARKRWMLSGLSRRGALHLDEGACQALHRRGSLLPAGITRVVGPFSRGDTLALLDDAGGIIGYGISAYGAEDVERIRGHRSDAIESILGYAYGEEVVHRNNLVLVDPARPTR